MKNNFSVRINIKRIIKYILLMAVCVLFYVFLRSYLFLLILTVMTIMPIYSVLSSLYMRKYVDIKIVSMQSRVCSDETASFEIRVNNSSNFVSPECKVCGKIENVFFDTSSDLEIYLTIQKKGSENIVLPFNTALIGCLNINIKSMEYKDKFGFITFFKIIDENRQTVVMPRANKSYKFDITSFSDGMSEAEESKMKGSDFSEVTEIREYRPGDRLRDIHWKLTAKKDSLMVKERESLSQTGVNLVIDISGANDEKDCNEICNSIEYLYALVREMVKNSTSVKVMWWNEALYDFNESSVYDEASLIGAFTRLLNDRTQKEAVNVRQLMQNCRKDINSYIYVHNTGEVVYNV